MNGMDHFMAAPPPQPRPTPEVFRRSYPKSMQKKREASRGSRRRYALAYILGVRRGATSTVRGRTPRGRLSLDVFASIQLQCSALAGDRAATSCCTRVREEALACGGSKQEGPTLVR